MHWKKEIALNICQQKNRRLTMKSDIFLAPYTRFCCILVGDDYDLLSRINDAKSNKKIQMFAMLMFLPMMLWGMTIFLIMQNVFMANLVQTFIATLTTVFIVGVVQRSLIMSKGDFWTKVIRYLIAIVLSLIGSFLIDEVIFEKDINRKIMEDHKSKIEARIEASKYEYENKIIAPQEKVVAQAAVKYDKASNNVSNETSALKGTGIKGAGQAVKVLSKQEQIERERYDIAKKELDILRASKEETLKAKAEQIRKEEVINDPSKSENINSIGLMYKIGAMFKLIASEWYMMVFWFVLTLLFFLFEMLPVFIKISESETFYEKLVEYHSSNAADKLTTKE